MWTIAAFAILVHFIVIFYSTFIIFFIYSGLRNRKEKERLGGELTEGEGQKIRAEEDLERKDRKSAEKTSKMKTTQQGNHSNNQPQH